MVITAEIVSIARHRIGIDGYGVVMLVVMKGCPLRCRFCLNKHALNGKSASFTPEKLLERVAIDNLYYLASGGGITFGGGEPLLNADFIKSFINKCNPDWTINVEISLKRFSLFFWSR
ncbi:MAG: radical SAM protein [Bacteroidales bacterium]|nr:radical SAM protein [Bacteroidales bacterium]